MDSVPTQQRRWGVTPIPLCCVVFLVASPFSALRRLPRCFPLLCAVLPSSSSLSCPSSSSSSCPFSFSCSSSAHPTSSSSAADAAFVVVVIASCCCCCVCCCRHCQLLLLLHFLSSSSLPVAAAVFVVVASWLEGPCLSLCHYAGGRNRGQWLERKRD